MIPAPVTPATPVVRRIPVDQRRTSQQRNAQREKTGRVHLRLSAKELRISQGSRVKCPVKGKLGASIAGKVVTQRRSASNVTTAKEGDTNRRIAK